MGRHRKESEHEPTVDESALGKAYDLKLCPKCGDKPAGPYVDTHGGYRCNCSHPKCGFWDSQVYNSADEAARGWNQAGGPDRHE